MQKNINNQLLLRAFDDAIGAIDSQMDSVSIELAGVRFAWVNRDQWLTLADVWQTPQSVQSPNPGYLDRLCAETHTNTFFFTFFLKRSFLRIIHLDGLRHSLVFLKGSLVDFQEEMLDLRLQRAWAESNADYVSLMISRKDFSSSQEIGQLYDNIAVAKNKIFSMIQSLLAKRSHIQEKTHSLREGAQAIGQSLFLNCFDALVSTLSQIESLALGVNAWLVLSQGSLNEPSFSSSLFYFQCNAIKILEMLKKYMNRLPIRQFLERKSGAFFPKKESFSSLYDLTSGLLSENKLVSSEANQVYNEMQAYAGIYANDDVGKIIESAQLYEMSDLLHLREMFMPELPISDNLKSLDVNDLRCSSYKYVLVVFLYSFLYQAIKRVGNDYSKNKKIFTQRHLMVDLVSCALNKMNSNHIFEGDFIVNLFRYADCICHEFRSGQVSQIHVPRVFNEGEELESKEAFTNSSAPLAF